MDKRVTDFKILLDSEIIRIEKILKADIDQKDHSYNKRPRSHAYGRVGIHSESSTVNEPCHLCQTDSIRCYSHRT